MINNKIQLEAARKNVAAAKRLLKESPTDAISLLCENKLVEEAGLRDLFYSLCMTINKCSRENAEHAFDLLEDYIQENYDPRTIALPDA